MFGYRLQRNIYWKRVVLLGAVILLTLLMPVVLPLLSLLGINLPSVPWYVVVPATLTGVAAELMVTFRVLGIHFWKDYPDECAVYYLHHLTREKLWHHLATYPWIDYIPNPLLAHIEKIIQEKPLDQLYGQGFLITGLPGAGKSTTIQRLVTCLRSRLYSRWHWLPSPKQPKLVVIDQPVLLLERKVHLPYFSEPTIIVIDDLQRLDSDQMRLISDYLKPYLRGRAIVLCAIQSPEMDKLTSTLRSFTRIDCSPSSFATSSYKQFLVKLIKAAARKFNLRISVPILENLIDEIVSGRQPLLYIVALFKYLREEEGLAVLTQRNFTKIPPELRVIYQKYWSDVKQVQYQADLLRAILLLKTLHVSITTKLLSTMFRFVFGHQTGFDHALVSLQGSVWLIATEPIVIAPDSPYAEVEFPTLSQRIKELWQMLKNKIITDKEVQALLIPLGIYFGRAQDYALAKTCFQEALKRRPKYLPALTLLGNSYQQLGEYTRAEEILQKAVKLDSEYGPAWAALGFMYQETKEYVKAKKALRKALTLTPLFEYFADFWAVLGFVYEGLGEFEMAKEALQKAIRLHPEHSLAWTTLGFLHYGLGEFEMAKEALQKAITQNPEFHPAWATLGVVCKELKEYGLAKEALQKAIRLNPNLSHTWCTLGIVYLNLSRFRTALEALQKAVDLDPRNTLALRTMASLHLIVKATRRVKEQLQETEEINPQLFRERFGEWKEKLQEIEELGPELFRERFGEAKETLLKVVEIDPKDVAAWTLLGYVYDELGEQDNAQDCRRRVENLRRQAEQDDED